MKKGKEKMGKKDVQKLFYKINPSGGISLIVLVITIIVVIILAAAVIISLQNNNPMTEANEARIKSDVANMQSIFTNTVGKIMAESQDVVEIDKSQLNTVTSGKKAVGIAKYKIKGTAVEGEIKFDAGAKTGTTYYTGRQLPLYNKETKWYVDSQGLVSVNIGGTKYGEGKQDGEVTPPTPEDPDTLKDGITKVGEKVTESSKEYEDANGDVAIIPIDFAIVPGKTNISNGLVISDVANDTGNIGNQFVWVPVDDMSTFVREQGYYNGSLQTSYPFESFSEPLNYNGTTASQGEIDEYNKMKASVEEYSGFYIGRYEISNNGSNKAQSKQNKAPWVNIKCRNSMTDLSGGIVEKAREMYPESEATKGKAVSTLVYGVCWDETVRFIEKNNIGVKRDSSEYGNYGVKGEDGNIVVLSNILTGSKPAYSLNNIYDMAGNVRELTMEFYQADYCVCRGGSSSYPGLLFPISYRDYTGITSTGSDIGGRCQLYIK